MSATADMAAAVAPSRGRPNRPYRFHHGLILCLALSAGLCALSLTSGKPFVAAPEWPLNGILLLLFGGWSLGLGWFGRDFAPVRALGSLDFTLATTAHLFLWVLLAGCLVPGQRESLPLWAQQLGLNDIVCSLPFFGALLLFLLNLSLALTLRLRRKTHGRLRFALSHGGLCIVLAAGLFSAGDLERWEIAVREGQVNALATNTADEERFLPFGIFLEDFSIEMHAPQLTLTNADETAIIWERGEPLIDLTTGSTGTLRGWRIEVLDTFDAAVSDKEGNFTGTGDEWAPPAARLRAEHIASGETAEGWISCGSPMSATHTLSLGDMRLAMALPRPELFRSQVTFLRQGRDPEARLIEVNQPIRVEGWSVYQLSYDETSGKASRWSTFEAVHDPWSPVVHLGGGMMALGAIGHIASRRNRNPASTQGPRP